MERRGAAWSGVERRGAKMITFYIPIVTGVEVCCNGVAMVVYEDHYDSETMASGRERVVKIVRKCKMCRKSRVIMDRR